MYYYVNKREARLSCCHQVIESLPARYAREITHLYMDAIHGYDSGRPKSVISGSLDDYGSKLSSLQTLVVNQPPAGHTCMFDSQPTLGDCLVQLCRATSSTLRALKVSASVRLDPTHTLSMLKDANNLHYLDIWMKHWGKGFSTQKARQRNGYTFNPNISCSILQKSKTPSSNQMA